MKIIYVQQGTKVQSSLMRKSNLVWTIPIMHILKYFALPFLFIYIYIYNRPFGSSLGIKKSVWKYKRTSVIFVRQI